MKEKFSGRYNHTTQDKYIVDYRMSKINSLNGENTIYRALVYKNGNCIKVLGAFDEENLQLQVENYFSIVK